MPVTPGKDVEHRNAEQLMAAPAGTTGDRADGPISLPINDRASTNLSLLYGGSTAKPIIRAHELVVAQPA